MANRQKPLLPALENEDRQLINLKALRGDEVEYDINILNQELRDAYDEVKLGLSKTYTDIPAPAHQTNISKLFG